MPPAAFGVYTLDIMHRLATRQAPVSAVCGAVAATPVEQSAIGDQVLHIARASQLCRFPSCTSSRAAAPLLPLQFCLLVAEKLQGQ